MKKSNVRRLRTRKRSKNWRRKPMRPSVSCVIWSPTEKSLQPRRLLMTTLIGQRFHLEPWALFTYPRNDLLLFLVQRQAISDRVEGEMEQRVGLQVEQITVDTERRKVFEGCVWCHSGLGLCGDDDEHQPNFIHVFRALSIP